MKKKDKMTDKIMHDIESGHVSMRPHWWFVAATVSAAISLMASIAVGGYLASMFVLKVRIALADRPAYGMRRNLGEMVTSFPWEYLFLALAGLCLALLIVRRFDFSYRIRMRYIVAISCVIILAAGIVGGLARYSCVQRHQHGQHTSSFNYPRYKN